MNVANHNSGAKGDLIQLKSKKKAHTSGTNTIDISDSDFVVAIVEFELCMNTAILLPNRNEIAGVSIGRNEHKNIQINNSYLSMNTNLLFLYGNGVLIKK